MYFGPYISIYIDIYYICQRYTHLAIAAVDELHYQLHFCSLTLHMYVFLLRIAAFHRKSGALHIVVVLNTEGQEQPYDGPGYRHPHRPPEPLQEPDRFPVIFSYPHVSPCTFFSPLLSSSLCCNPPCSCCWLTTTNCWSWEKSVQVAGEIITGHGKGYYRS